jgi:uncharacterized protein (TIGR00255 family)
MIKSMTGFSKAEAKENGANSTVEIKSLNGRFLEINCKIPRVLSHKELEIRDIIRNSMERGTVNINVTIDSDKLSNLLNFDENAASECYNKLNNLKSRLKIKGQVELEHLLQFAPIFQQKEEEANDGLYWKLTQKALREALNQMDKMRKAEGQNITKDIQARMKKIQANVDNIESLGIERIPSERERLRQRVAQLFETDEIDEQRLQMEILLLADKLDISEECVRLRSHFKYFYETIKSKEASGKKLNFLMQEFLREINTVGSKANDATISQIVVDVKEELERIREQVQNIE